MSHRRALGFDALEGRTLLSGSRVAVHHSTPMIAATPVVLDGTLAVDNNSANITTNPDGTSISSTPVAGRLGALGKVRGVWNVGLDTFGDTTGVNALRLHAPKGSLVISFSTVNTVKPHPAARGAVYYPRAQQLVAGTGAYAKATESGMIDLTTNPGRKQTVSLALMSTNA